LLRCHYLRHRIENANNLSQKFCLAQFISFENI
jgi:hypothetical protein